MVREKVNYKEATPVKDDFLAESDVSDEIGKMYVQYSGMSICENNNEQGAIIQEMREAVLRLIINLGTDSAIGISEEAIGERPVRCITQACAWNTVNLRLLRDSLEKLESFICN